MTDPNLYTIYENHDFDTVVLARINLHFIISDGNGLYFAYRNGDGVKALKPFDELERVKVYIKVVKSEK